MVGIKLRTVLMKRMGITQAWEQEPSREELSSGTFKSCHPGGGHWAEQLRCCSRPPDPTSECLGSSLHFFLTPLPATANPGKQQGMAQVIESLPPLREAEAEFPASDFDLTAPAVVVVW